MNHIKDMINAVNNPVYPELEFMGAGESVFIGLKGALEELCSSTSEDHDVLVIVRDVAVRDVSFRDHDTLVFKGFNGDGHSTVVLIHYTQLVAHVVSRPKQGPERVITGFAPIQREEN